jgi:hypothetical protein
VREHEIQQNLLKTPALQTWFTKGDSSDHSSTCKPNRRAQQLPQQNCRNRGGHTWFFLRWSTLRNHNSLKQSRPLNMIQKRLQLQLSVHLETSSESTSTCHIDIRKAGAYLMYFEFFLGVRELKANRQQWTKIREVRIQSALGSQLDNEDLLSFTMRKIKAPLQAPTCTASPTLGFFTTHSAASTWCPPGILTYPVGAGHWESSNV